MSKTAINIATRLMGLLLAAIAVEFYFQRTNRAPAGTNDSVTFKSANINQGIILIGKNNLSRRERRIIPMKKSLSKKARKVIEEGVQEFYGDAALDGTGEDRGEDDVTGGSGGRSDGVSSFSG